MIVASVLGSGLAAGPFVATPDASALAQNTGQTQFSESQLRSYAAATLRRERLERRWTERIEAAGLESQRVAMRRFAREEMRQAVRREGLSLREFRAIAELVSRNPALADVVETYRVDLTGQAE